MSVKYCSNTVHNLDATRRPGCELSARLNQGGQDSAIRELSPVQRTQLSVPCIPHISPTMRSLSPALASLANVFRIPMSLAPVRPTASRVCHEVLARRTQQPGPIAAAVQSAPFSSTSTLEGRKNRGPNVDKRISMLYLRSSAAEVLHCPRLLAGPISLDSVSHEQNGKALSILTWLFSSYPLLPLPPPHSPPSALLAKPLPPPLDNPPRLAIVPG